MSFRGRLALFFLLIVAIPIAAIALLVVDVTRDSQAGKADARLSTGLQHGAGRLRGGRRRGRGGHRRAADHTGGRGGARVGRSGSDRTRNAHRRTGRGTGTPRDRHARRRRDQRPGLGGAARAWRPSARPGKAATTSSAAPSPGRSSTSTRWARSPGWRSRWRTTRRRSPASPSTDGAQLPPAGESGDVEVEGETQRAAAGELPEEGSARVVLFTETETGGFFDSRPRIAVAVAIFLIVALLFVGVVLRALRGQIGSMLDAARRIGSGDFSGRVPVVGRDEMAGLANEFNEMSDRLEAQIDLLRRQRTELDRSVTRLGDAVAAGLDQNALLEIVAETALGGCSAEYASILVEDGTVIERPEGFDGPARTAAEAGQARALREGTHVASAARQRPRAGGSIASRRYASRDAGGRARRPDVRRLEREIFVHLLNRASASIENVRAHERVSEQAVTDELTGLANNRFVPRDDRPGGVARRALRARAVADHPRRRRLQEGERHLRPPAGRRGAAGDRPASWSRSRAQSTSRRATAARSSSSRCRRPGPRARWSSPSASGSASRTRRIASVDGGKPLRVTASIGTATLPDAAADVRELFEAADEALYEAKRQGKNRVVTAPAVARSRQ